MNSFTFSKYIAFMIKLPNQGALETYVDLTLLLNWPENVVSQVKSNWNWGRGLGQDHMSKETNGLLFFWMDL